MNTTASKTLGDAPCPDVGAGSIACPSCKITFTPKRKNQQYCGRGCQRNASRGSRPTENAQRSRDHYDRASWLSYDVNRMSPPRQRAMILALLEGASGGSAALRNILLDPALLGAAWDAPIGKFYPDTKSPGTLNIAKMVNAFCQAEYGCHVRDAILDDGKPAGRKFIEDDD